MSLKETRSETASDDSAGSAGLEPTRQVPASAIATVDASDVPPSEVWREIATADGFRRVLVDAVRDLLADVPHHDRAETLYDAGVTVANGGYATVLTSLNDAHETISAREWAKKANAQSPVQYQALMRHDEALEVTAEFGQPEPSFIGYLELDELCNGPLALLDAVDETPTVAVRLDEDFRERPREQREDTCRLLADLSEVCEVRVVCDAPIRVWLRDKHRSDLPGVSEWSSAQCCSGSVGAALEGLDPDGREATILRLLADAPAETLSYHAIRSEFDVSRSRVSQCLSTLSGYGLIETFGATPKASLLEAGREFLSQITTQTTLENPVSTTPKTHLHNRVNPTAQDSPPQTEFYRTAWMNRPQHSAAVACSTGNSGIVTVEDDISHHSSKDRLVSYDENRREAVVSVAGGSVQEYTVSIATALTTPMFLDTVLPTSELAKIVEDEPAAILRGARCIGWLSDEALDDAQTFRDRLVEQGGEVADLTRQLRHGEPENAKKLCSEIVRIAQGLAGTVVHLLDRADVTLVREIRVPGGLSLDQLDDLAESITTSALIQSRYGAFAAYRQLFESRDEKRRTALSPQVDSTDPVGSLIGEFVIRGPDSDRMKSAIEGQLSGFKPHDEAPEFAINVPVRSVNRSAYAVVSHRTLKSKNIKPTREAVTILHGLVDSPYHVAHALNQLGQEDTPRELRADELRYALAYLDGEHILSELPRSVGEIVAALLDATEPLTQTELAERADVSTQTIRNNRDALEALDVVRVDGTEWRVALSFSTKEERRSGIVPALVSEGALFRDVLSEFLHEILPPERYGDPSDPVAGAVFHPVEPWVLLEHDELAGWVKLIARLTETEIPENRQSSAVSVGPPLQQQPIQQTSPAIAD